MSDATSARVGGRAADGVRSAPRSAVEVRTSTCILDCPDACTLEVAVEPASGRIESIGGVREGHPTTEGYICRKVTRFGERIDHRERVLHPLRRTGPKGSGRFERIGWDEALAEVAERFAAIRERWGGEAILPCHYGGSNGILSDGFVDHHLFARLGASRLARTICAIPTGLVATGMYGKMPGVAYGDFERAEAILVWGANPKASGIHLVPFLRRAKQNGAFIAAIDPVRNFSSREIDLHLPVRPGADLPLALGMIHRWREQGRLAEDFLAAHADGLETLLAAAEAWPPERAARESGVEVADLLRVADVFAAASPAVVRCGWGLERNRNGGQAVAAVLAIPALLGKFGVRGGGYLMSNSKASRFAPPPELAVPPWRTRVISLTRLGTALDGEPANALEVPAPARSAEIPVRALFVYNCNPLATVPDQSRVLAGLEREDLFTVVHEQVMTDTARYADLVLPATTMLEHRDVRIGYGSYVVGASQPVIEPRGEARSNVETFAALGRAFGFDDAVFDLDDASAFAAVTAHLEMAGSAPSEPLAAGEVQLYDFPGATPVQFGTVFPATEDGKIHLTPPELGPEPYRYFAPGEPVPGEHGTGDERSNGRAVPGADAELDGPLTLISPATNELLNSTFGESSVDRLAVTLHPDEAAARGVVTGDAVRVWNRLGEVRCEARVDARVRPGVALMPKGAWRRSTANAFTSTVLCSPHTNRVGGGACYNDARVEIEKI